jgi:hypothetical protein
MSSSLADVATLPFGFFSGNIQVSARPVQVRYSALREEGTRLPMGIQPTALLQHATGFNIIARLIQKGGTEVAATVESSLEYVRAVAEAVPLDEEDERLIDALVARKMASADTRPLRRKG